MPLPDKRARQQIHRLQTQKLQTREGHFDFGFGKLLGIIGFDIPALVEEAVTLALERTSLGICPEETEDKRWDCKRSGAL
jgi:ATP-dependent 26S proteasome regulatory subunit